MAEPSQAPAPGVFEAPKTKDEKIDIKSHLSDPRVRKHIYYFLGLSVLGFLPMIFAAISLSFSTPSAGAKVAVYLTTLAAAFLTIGYSAYITRKKVMVMLGRRGDSRIFATEVNIVGTVAEAFTPEQQQYATTADAAHAQELAALSPTLASQTYNPYGRPSIDQSLNMYPHQQPPRPSQDVGPYPQMPQPMRSPAPATPLPNIPVPLPPALPMRMPDHLGHQPNRNSRLTDPESDYEYSDDSRVHSFQTVMVRPNEASSRGEQAYNMQYNANAPAAPHQPYQPYNSMILPQLPMVAPAGQLTMPHQSGTNGLTNTTMSGQNQVYGNSGNPQSGMHSADTSIDDLVVGMLESFHEGERQSQFVNNNNNVNNVSNRSSYRFSHPPPLNMSTESFDYPGQIRDSQFRIANVPSQPDSPISGNFADSREVKDIPTASRTVRRSAIVNFMRKEDAKRKLLAEDTDDDFIDNDSDDGSDAGEQNGNRNPNENQARDQSVDQNQSQSQNQGEGEGLRKANWKPTSANLDNLVAQLAKVLIHPDEPTDTLLDNRNNEAKEEGNDGDLDEPDIVYLGSAQASPRRAEQITTPPPQKATVFRRLEHETGSTSSIVDAYSRGSTATLDGADTRIHSMTIRLSANSAASNPASNPATTSADSTFVPPAPTLAPTTAPSLPPTKALPLPPMRAPPPPASNVLPTPSQMLPQSPDQTQASTELPQRPPQPPALPPQPL
ncbi:hypothetical protein H4217_000562 [Coemansia sp. RSA 1939]|nr:hypothetical protein H4217_000562 [Coemansia sp. RSA 1939]KAJ2612232.1 hypothetical protein EV177_003097 [Coemansia sp. RSA 1804]